MIQILQAAHPEVLINNEIIEPNPQHVAAYKGEASRAPLPSGVWPRPLICMIIFYAVL